MLQTIVRNRRELPNAEFYVSATDTENSGTLWTDKKRVRLIFPCSQGQVAAVKYNLALRRKFKHITVATSRPILRKRDNVIYILITPEDSPAWFRR